MAMFNDQLKQVVRRLSRAPAVHGHHAAHAGHRRRREHGDFQRGRGRAAEAAALSSSGAVDRRVAHARPGSASRN